MLKLISLFFIGIFIISCGGEVGVVYHNNPNTSGSTNNSGNSNGSTNPNTSKLTCLPGADCNIKQPSANIRVSNACLPGVECSPVDIKVDTGTSTDTKKPGSDTNSSTTKKPKSCLPGQTTC